MLSQKLSQHAKYMLSQHAKVKNLKDNLPGGEVLLQIYYIEKHAAHIILKKSIIGGAQYIQFLEP